MAPGLGRATCEDASAHTHHLPASDSTPIRACQKTNYAHVLHLAPQIQDHASILEMMRSSCVAPLGCPAPARTRRWPRPACATPGLARPLEWVASLKRAAPRPLAAQLPPWRLPRMPAARQAPPVPAAGGVSSANEDKGNSCSVCCMTRSKDCTFDCVHGL